MKYRAIAACFVILAVTVGAVVVSIGSAGAVPPKKPNRDAKITWTAQVTQDGLGVLFTATTVSKSDSFIDTWNGATPSGITQADHGKYVSQAVFVPPVGTSNTNAFYTIAMDTKTQTWYGSVSMIVNVTVAPNGQVTINP